MTLDEVIAQLEDLEGHCLSMAEKDDPDCVWNKDVKALGIAIEILKGDVADEV